METPGHRRMFVFFMIILVKLIFWTCIALGKHILNHILEHLHILRNIQLGVLQVLLPHTWLVLVQFFTRAWRKAAADNFLYLEVLHLEELRLQHVLATHCLSESLAVAILRSIRFNHECFQGGFDLTSVLRVQFSFKFLEKGDVNALDWNFFFLQHFEKRFLLPVALLHLLQIVKLFLYIIRFGLCRLPKEFFALPALFFLLQLLLMFLFIWHLRLRKLSVDLVIEGVAKKNGWTGLAGSAGTKLRLVAFDWRQYSLNEPFVVHLVQTGRKGVILNVLVLQLLDLLWQTDFKRVLRRPFHVLRLRRGVIRSLNFARLGQTVTLLRLLLFFILFRLVLLKGHDVINRLLFLLPVNAAKYCRGKYFGAQRFGSLGQLFIGGTSEGIKPLRRVRERFFGRLKLI